MDNPDLTVSNFAENYIGHKRVNNMCLEEASQEIIVKIKKSK